MPNDDYEGLPPVHLRPRTFTRRALGVLAACLALAMPVLKATR